ncbi:MAG: ADP-ribosylglycohydrolase family protein [Deltaproteobacteria bacterium]|nr:ADP-ribosylglycohydrolase family protein [Deltaproteobacteria bacterium]
MHLDRAWGALLGQAVGDALGTTLEFQTAAQIARRWPDGLREIVGGGPFDLLPGQITDDTELALALARSLAERRRFDPADVMRRYEAWAASGPFDMGMTCRAAFQDGRPNPTSQANGALMRASPLGVWGAGRTGLAEAAAADAALSHPHPACVAANVAFTRAIAFAIETGADARAVHAEAVRVAEGTPAHRWLVAAASALPPDFQTQMGWVAIALQNAFYQLLHAESFEEGVVDTARRGGDTDTNAAIAGALLGAVHGARAIPARWSEAVLSCDAPRPALWRANDLRALAMQLVRPTVAVADLHGHSALLRALVDRLDAELGEYALVLLGDYVDNGPDVPGLLDLALALREERGDRFHAILGNHDLACLLALDDDAWFAWWSARYWNPGRGTPAQYGAGDRSAFRQRFPTAHRELLASLPWFYDDGAHLFVHAGLEPGPLGPQVEALAQRRMPSTKLHLPPPLREKDLAVAHDPAWDRVVVSGHTRSGHIASRAPGHPGLPHFVTATRITLSAEVDSTGVLYAVILPERRFVSAPAPASRAASGSP